LIGGTYHIFYWPKKIRPKIQGISPEKPLVAYPLVNVYITNWKDPPFLMGKSAISTGPFSIAMLIYQRVTLIPIPLIMNSKYNPIHQENHSPFTSNARHFRRLPSGNF